MAGPYIYTPQQTSAYLARIGFTSSPSTKPSLPHLSSLQLHHITHIPFENLSIHYSRTHTISVSPPHIFHKLVTLSRGGYCMELNSGFATLLRGMGYDVLTGGGRICADMNLGREKGGEVFEGWTHMPLIVGVVEGERYLVDVGLGSTGPTRPISLHHGAEIESTATGERHRLIRKTIEYANSGQELWRLQIKKHDGGEWIDCYTFTETEFLENDYEAMSYFTSTHPDQIFVKSLICAIFIPSEDGKDVVGRKTLNNTEFKEIWRREVKVLKTCATERDRVDGLREIFGIELSEEEVKGMEGRAPEIKPTKR
ncbi:hypothetical protein YB2330_003382 [Saitoella coloradoensis]